MFTSCKLDHNKYILIQQGLAAQEPISSTYNPLSLRGVVTMKKQENEATINGVPLTVFGSKLQPGDMTPEVTLRDGTLTIFNLLEDTTTKSA